MQENNCNYNNSLILPQYNYRMLDWYCTCIFLLLFQHFVTFLNFFFNFYIKKVPAKGKKNTGKKKKSPDPVKRTVGEIEAKDGDPI